MFVSNTWKQQNLLTQHLTTFVLRTYLVIQRQSVWRKRTQQETKSTELELSEAEGKAES